ncbi:hypothetical protein MMC19_001526 [Ptychographa xylographoides]|nr:hypothetical protein [Ptychographa xylographoides]
METEVQEKAAIPPKFSRYRSVRIVAGQKTIQPSVPALPAQDAVKRSMSRYKNARPTGSTVKLPEHSPKALWQSIQQGPDGLVHGDISPTNTTKSPSIMAPVQLQVSSDINAAAGKDHLLPERNDHIAATGSESHRQTLPSGSAIALPRNPSEGGEARPPNLQERYNHAQRQAYAMLCGEAERQKLVRHRPQEKAIRAIRLGNLDVQHSNESPSTREFRHDRKGPLTGVVTGRKSAKTAPEESTVKLDHPQTKAGPQDSRRQKAVSPILEPLRPTVEVPAQTGGLSGIDAPISAVNAGVRNVSIKYNKSFGMLPIVLSTTVVDILRSASSVFSDNIDPSSTILVESFKLLGLERPLRRYEHIREIVNSWDHDGQNNLIIARSPTNEDNESLEVFRTPAQQPDEMIVNIYHSQRPGEWDKRWITLRADGQMMVAKVKGGESKNICHMSDFDIYTPTSRQMKKLQPPRKHCYCIKSQQKSAMFLTTENFAHFFATKDKTLAQDFYKAVQGWRSWYLVNIMGNGKKAPRVEQTVSRVSLGPHKAELPYQHHHDIPQKSPVHQPYDLKSSLRLNKSNASDATSVDHLAQEKTRATTLVRPIKKSAVPSVSLPKSFGREINHVACGPSQHSQNIIPGFLPMQSTEHATPTTGKLSRSGSRRQEAMLPQAYNTRAKRNSIGLAIPPSHHQKDVPVFKPLVDLTPQFQEPPQFSKRGRGITLSHIPPGGLVNIATSPESAIPLPQSATWRRPGSSYGEDPQTPRIALMRSPATHAPDSAAGRADEQHAFIMGGLLAQAGTGQGAREQGRVAKRGDRQARGPMLEADETSLYVPGSLLAYVQQQTGPVRPAIDREKRRTIVTSTGEGAYSDP